MNNIFHIEPKKSNKASHGNEDTYKNKAQLNIAKRENTNTNQDIIEYNKQFAYAVYIDGKLSKIIQRNRITDYLNSLIKQTTSGAVGIDVISPLCYGSKYEQILDMNQTKGEMEATSAQAGYDIEEYSSHLDSIPSMDRMPNPKNVRLSGNDVMAICEPVMDKTINPVRQAWKEAQRLTQSSKTEPSDSPENDDSNADEVNSKKTSNSKFFQQPAGHPSGSGGFNANKNSSRFKNKSDNIGKYVKVVYTFYELNREGLKKASKHISAITGTDVRIEFVRDVEEFSEKKFYWRRFRYTIMSSLTAAYSTLTLIAILIFIFACLLLIMGDISGVRTAAIFFLIFDIVSTFTSSYGSASLLKEMIVSSNKNKVWANYYHNSYINKAILWLCVAAVVVIAQVLIVSNIKASVYTPISVW